MYIVAPICDNILNKLALKYRIVLAVSLVGLFGFDLIYSHFNPHSGEGITSKVTKEGLLLDDEVKKSKQLAKL